MSEPEGRSRPATALAYVLAAGMLVVWFFMFTDSVGEQQPTPTTRTLTTDSQPVIVGLPRLAPSIQSKKEGDG